MLMKYVLKGRLYRLYYVLISYKHADLLRAPMCKDLCVLSGKKINPLTLPTGRQAQRITKFSTRGTQRATE